MDKTNNAVVNVVSVEGDVVVLDTAGSMRAVQINDQLQPGEKLITSGDSEAVVSLGGETVEQLPSDSVALVVIDPETGEVYLNIQTLLEQSQDEESELSEIEQLILAGADPTELLEETAAGGEGGGTAPANDGFTGLGEVLRTGESVIAEAGYDTGTDDDGRDGGDDQQPAPAELVVPLVTPVVNIVATDPSAIEGEVGDSVIFTVSRDFDNGANSTVIFTVSGGDAFTSQDISQIVFADATGTTVISTQQEISSFLSAGQTLTLGGNAAATVTFIPADDSLFEGAEVFNAGLVAGNNVTLGSASASGEFQDEDGNNPDNPKDEVIVSLTGPSDVVEGETTTDYTVSLSEAVPAGKSVTVALTYSYTTASGTDITEVADVTITGPASSATFNIATIDDALA
ncbi:retention module-containing protein, partial [Aliamphritea spongicola]|uniref:retention module-containing protein n=2 Tax=Aliamphritea spongicola TaxID=707589 RepID=UPI00196BA36F